MSERKLSEKLVSYRADRPDEGTIAGFIRAAKKLEHRPAAVPVERLKKCVYIDCQNKTARANGPNAKELYALIAEYEEKGE